MKTLQLHKPHLLVIVGLPGAGKSFFAKQFADMFGAPYIDYRHFHKLVGSEDTGDVVATELLGQLFLTKQTILMEGRGETKQDRGVLAKLAKSKGYELFYVWVQADGKTTLKRSVYAKDASYTEDEYIAQSEVFAPLEQHEPHVVISGRHTYASQAKVVLKKLVAPRTTTVRTPVIPPRIDDQKRPGRIIVG